MPENERPAPREPAASPDLRVRAAWLYYVEGMTQEQIARFMNISRAKVIRLLASARDNGIVRIRIEDRASEQVALERQLVAAFGLADAIVVPAPADEADDHHRRRARRGHLSDRPGQGRHVARRRLGRDAAHEPEGAGRATVRAAVGRLAAGRHDPLARRQSVGRRAAHRRRVRRRLLSADGTGHGRRRIGARGAVVRAGSARAARAGAPRRPGAGQRRRCQRRGDAVSRGTAAALGAGEPAGARAPSATSCAISSTPRARSSITRSTGASSRSTSTICGACPRSSWRRAGAARSRRYAPH